MSMGLEECVATGGLEEGGMGSGVDAFGSLGERETKGGKA